MYACIGATSSCGFYIFSQQGREGFFQNFLHGNLLWLNLITKKMSSIVGKFYKIPHNLQFKTTKIVNFYYICLVLVVI